MTKRTALTGFIVPKCKVYGNGFFSENPNDPDEFDNELKQLKDKYDTPIVLAKKAEYEKIKNEKITNIVKPTCEFRNNRIVIHRKINILKNLDDNTIVIPSRNKLKLGYSTSYRNKKGIKVNTEKLAIISTRFKLNKNSDKLVIMTRKKKS